MSLDKNRIPREMLGDIILTFLLGVKTEHWIDGKARIFDVVRSLHHQSYALWSDIFSMREAVIKRVRKLAKALKKVWKL